MVSFSRSSSSECAEKFRSQYMATLKQLYVNNVRRIKRKMLKLIDKIEAVEVQIDKQRAKEKQMSKAQKNCKCGDQKNGQHGGQKKRNHFVQKTRRVTKKQQCIQRLLKGQMTVQQVAKKLKIGVHKVKALT